MADKIGKKSTKLEKSSREDQFVVLLENMRDEIKLVAEGNLMLQEKMDRGFWEVNGRIDSLECNVEMIKTDVASMREEMSNMKEEMRMGFRGMMAESIALGKKIDGKADKKDLLVLEKRVAKLEAAH